jgi:16S rRNA processing protein RimM
MNEPASVSAAAGLPADAVEVGRILGGWGVKGWLKVQPFSGDPQALTSSRQWFLVPGPRVAGAVSGVGSASTSSAPSASSAASAGPAQPAVPTQLEIVRAKLQAGTVLATARGVLDRDAADRLAGARVYVPRSQFPAADEGEYYWVDLIGLDVVNREGQMLGQVASLIETGVHDVLKVLDASSEAPVERLIPFVPVYIDRVDLPGRRINVDWGLDY